MIEFEEVMDIERDYKDKVCYVVSFGGSCIPKEAVEKAKDSEKGEYNEFNFATIVALTTEGLSVEKRYDGCDAFYITEDPKDPSGVPEDRVKCIGVIETLSDEEKKELFELVRGDIISEMRS